MSLAGWLFWIGGVGGGLFLPAWMYWHRRRCLADERFPKDADGKGIFAGQTVDEADQTLLERWQRRMVTTFVACLAFLPLVAFGAAMLGLLESNTAAYAFVSLLFLVVAVAASVQFSAKCPHCRYRIGFQSRLLLPESCERCGVAFKHNGG